MKGRYVGRNGKTMLGSVHAWPGRHFKDGGSAYRVWEPCFTPCFRKKIVLLAGPSLRRFRNTTVKQSSPSLLAALSSM